MDYSLKQWAAVMTHRSLSIVPTQNDLPLASIITVQGNCPTPALSPPTILAWIGLFDLPHPGTVIVFSFSLPVVISIPLGFLFQDNTLDLGGLMG